MSALFPVFFFRLKERRMMKSKLRPTVVGITAVVWLFTLQSAFGQTSSQLFYSLEVVASTSASLDVFAAPSINDFGDVAFAGRLTPGGGTVFRSRLGLAYVDMMPGFSSNNLCPAGYR